MPPAKSKKSKKAKEEPISSLSEIAFEKVLKELEECIEGEKASALFVCGGKIDVTKENPQPIICCWTANNDSYARWLRLPISSEDSTTDQLAADCQPASFGRGQENVMDPEYRKAGKLEPSQFLTNFNPVECGIIEKVGKLLAPHLVTGKGASLASREIRAELYKMNVYSGPSGLFKKHFDTPRSPNQIGSLVVCLPSTFKGGNLIVRHNGNEVDFSWDRRSAEAIQWAAFYSDCEHEITKVTEGHRITLTYNLFVESIDTSTPLSSMVEPESLPLYGVLKNILQAPVFMQKGGVLGFFCSHAYPHASYNVGELLPRGLKGSDLGIYSVLHSLGLEPEVLPVCIAESGHDSSDESCDGFLSVVQKLDSSKKPERGDSPKEGDSPEEGDSPVKVQFRHLKGFKGIVGSKLQPYYQAENGPDISFHELLDEEWVERKKYDNPITWIASPKHYEEALGYMAYGNEASPDNIYSFAAIMVEIPPWAERNSGCST